MTCAHCADLKERVAYLESELGLRVQGDKIRTLRTAFRLSDQEARALLIIRDRGQRYTSRPNLNDNLPSPLGRDERVVNIASKVVGNVRKKIGRDHVEVRSGFGYRLTEAGRSAVDSALGAA